MTAPAIQVEGVTVHYGEVLALDAASLSLQPARICGLVGMNGSGKSTLFKTIMGIVKPDSGRVLVNDHPPPKVREEAGIGYVPQSEDVDWAFPLSVRDVVMMGRCALLLGLLALTSVVALQTVGMVLVVAMLIIPGSTAYLLTDRFSRMLMIAPAISAVCSVAGIYLSCYLDTASGAMVVLTQGAVFAVVYLFSPRQGLIATRLSRRRRQRALATAA